MISDDKWRRLCAAYLKTRSISASAVAAETSRLTAMRYIERSNGRYPSIRSIAERANTVTTNRILKALENTAVKIADTLEKTTLKPKGKTLPDGTTEISISELRRLQETLKDSYDNLAEITSRLQDEQDRANGVSRQPIVVSNETREMERRRTQRFEEIVSVERRFLTTDELTSLTPSQRARTVAVRLLRGDFRIPGVPHQKTFAETQAQKRRGTVAE